MLVFLCWSGARSKAVAEALHGWLPQVIQAVDPWISVDIDKGRRWSLEIADRLERSKVGIICFTKDNLDARWILFEAGAISKTKDAHVCTFLLDVGPADIEPPLGDFQHTAAEKEDVLRLVTTINARVKEASERSLPEGVLRKTFETFWPDLDKQLAAIRAQTPISPRPERSDREMLEEILEIVRELGREPDLYDQSMVPSLGIQDALISQAASGKGAKSIELAQALQRQMDEYRRGMEKLLAKHPGLLEEREK